MTWKTPAALLVLVQLSFFSYAQKTSGKPVTFGDVTVADFAPQVYMNDSSAEAVVLYDGGSAKFEGNSNSWFNIVYTYHKRIRLLNKNAFSAATVEIPLYTAAEYADELDKMEAATYTLENGAVVKTRIDKSSVFKDRTSRDQIIKKFTFPNLKPGCIIEYTYTITSPGSNFLRNWVFQGRYPVLQSDYETFVPTIFDFVCLNSGSFDLQPKVEMTTDIFRLLTRVDNSAFSSSDPTNFTSNVAHSTWSLKNLPALIPEKYTTTIWNYLAKIEFQLRTVTLPNSLPHPILQSWSQLATEMLKNEKFGGGLSEKNRWMETDLAALDKNSDSVQTARNIFSYVQQNFSCTDHTAVSMTGTLHDTYSAKKGSVAEINLLLVAMLRKAGFSADPVLLSTRENGFAYEAYPLVNKFNYVICRAQIAGKTYMLDASEKKIGFNLLPEICYNGSGRVIDPDTRLVSLSADSLKETKTTTIFISNGAKKMEGSFNSDLGYYESYDLRDELAASGKDEFIKALKAGYTGDITIQNPGIDSLTQYDNPVSVHYDFSIPFDEDIIYFSPLLSEAYKTNPFTAATRNYPVEMPYTSREIIVLNMEIPTGYKVDELPKSERVKLNEDEGSFEYIVQSDASMVQLQCKLLINRANFDPEDYQTLREFYGHVVKKEAEQIVFKKIK